MDPGFSNIPNNQIKNYLQNAAAHKPGITHEEVKDYYNKWSLKYEQDLNETVYRGPKIAANLCDTFVWDKLNSNILDIGCGTGLIGEHLAKSGFKWIDGLEPCENMVKVARSKNIYRRFFMETIRDEVDTSLPDDFYDACVISGAFGEGHIPSNGLYEILRVVKPGGYVINVMRREYLNYVNDYVDRLEPLMEHMEKVENKWALITKFDVDNYSFNKTGRIYVFRKN